MPSPPEREGAHAPPDPPQLGLFEPATAVVRVSEPDPQSFACDRAEELRILYQIAASVGASLNLQRILCSAGRRLLDLVSYDGLAIYITDTLRREARLAIALGLGAGTIRRIGRAVPFGTGFAGRVGESGQPIVASDFATVAAMAAHPAVLRLGVQTFAAIPLKARDRVVGVLNLSSLSRHTVTEEERRMLEAVGSILGMAIENARLYERAQAQARQQRLQNAIAEQLRRFLDVQQVCSTAVRELCRALRADRCCLAEIGSGVASVSHEHLRQGVPSARGAHSLEGLSPDLLRFLSGGRMLVVEDMATHPATAPYYMTRMPPLDSRSMLLVPLLAGGRLRALLAVGQWRRPRRWTSDDIALAQFVADHTALAVENARLFERIRESERAYMALYDEAPDMYHTVDAEGIIRLCNETEARTLGYAKEELMGRPWSQLCPPEDVAGLLQGLADPRAAGGLTREMRLRTRAGEELEVSARATPILEEGGVAGARVVMRDMTAQRRLERQLQQAQKMESLGTLAGGIAHDFNNLLTAMVGYATLIKRAADPGDPIHRYADTIERTGQRAAELTRQMLAFAREGTLHRRRIDLNAVIRETVELLSRTLDKRIVLSQDLAAGLPPIQADPVQIEQVLINLCLNARDAMPHGGTITIRSRLAPAPRDGNGARVVVTVADTGHGIDHGTRQRIFDPFFTTKAPGKGTGLGLAMSYGIIAQHGGEIDVESAPDTGTAFTVTLPALPQGTPLDAPPAQQAVAAPALRVLVVDDEEVVRDLLGDLLRSHGMEATLFGRGADAVEHFARHHREVDVVLTDMLMPEMSGADVFHAVRRIDPEARVLLISGYSSDRVAEGLLAAGACGFLRKPCSTADLLAAIQQAVEGANGAPSARK